ncbi:MAG: VOC family protein [Chloroflexi bacterium]|nr:VOC family protein [Chloroflexota bacterium]
MNFGNVRFVIYSDQYQASVNFYGTVMNLERIATWDRSPEERGSLYNGHGAAIEVVQASSKRPAGRPTGIELRYRVDNVDAWHRKITATKVPVLYGPIDQPWGERDLAVNDPNGVKITLFTDLEDLKRAPSRQESR